MPPPLLALQNVALSFGGTPLLTSAELIVAPGDRIALVGRNGSGKSTLLKIAAGTVQPDSGDRFVHPGAVIRYLAQETVFTGFRTTFEFVEAGLKPTDDPYVARQALNDLGLTGEEDVARLSGGEARRTALAQAIASRPDVLLLDEPTNHLDLPAIEWLERTVAGLKSAILLISHDRRFLETLSRTTVWLDRGITRRMEAGFGGFESWRDDLLMEEERDAHKLDRKIVREEKWMHGGVTARRKRNVRRVRELADLRQQRRERRSVEGSVRLEASEAQQSGKLVIEASNIGKSFPDRIAVDEFTIRIMRGDQVGFVGPNGAGKTTLIKLLTGALEPDSGSVRLGTGLEMVVLDQKRDDLDPTWTVAEALTRGRGDQVIVNGKPRHVASYMKDFLFLPEQVRSPVSVLSGGERARLMLARALALPSNLLVLDEPTNDLDLETLDLLQELLADYQGTVLLVSHDRDFLDRVVTSTVGFDGEGRWIEYAGGYTDMLAQRGKPLPISVERAEIAPSQARLASGGRQAEARTGEDQLGAASSRQETAVPQQKRKLSFKEKHALEKLPGEIARLQAEISELEGKIADPAFFNSDAAAFRTATEQLAVAQGALFDAETQWLDLEILREEISSSS
ncbi:MAG TPA: ATP-binding cassette domain-containing protein [Hyphomicrobiaceae bacterium]|nr:ATP-binding cassette domain-containing protein [Hyphomicrobiaceae bacterium]MCC0009817.1 ATP-binding cassette domain-containing protein [Hyphomicrobiaceae bacterium]HRY08132.1 ATP-binding cassette domain-containing protein [Hyphomicrobiaceae bacterium]